MKEKNYIECEHYKESKHLFYDQCSLFGYCMVEAELIVKCNEFMKKESNCRKCDFFEVFSSKTFDKIIYFCHSKGHQIHMIDSITACPEWYIYYGKREENNV